MMSWLVRRVFYPLWEKKEGASRLGRLAELRRTQWFPLAELQARQWRRLQAMVSHAGATCPYYRNLFREVNFEPHRFSAHDFQQLPLLPKDLVRAHAAELRSAEFTEADLVEARTGGSTGKALRVLYDKECQQDRNAVAMRSDEWAGRRLGMKVAAIWGNPPSADSPKKWLRNALLDRMMYLDTMNLSEATVSRFVDAWRRQRPEVIFGHAHSIYMTARFLRGLGVDDLRPKAIIATSMMLLDKERGEIQETFGCPVTNRYGCEEVGLIASECDRHQGLHLNVDHLFIEFLRPDGSPASPGEEARIVVTDLVNRGMPFIRYDVGDMVMSSDRVCECGRGLPLVERVTGRVADFLKRRDGSLVAGVSLVERTLTAIPGLDQMQIIQESMDRITLNIVPDESYDPESEKRLREEVTGIFGEGTQLNVVPCESLPQTRSGKYRFSICLV